MASDFDELIRTGQIDITTREAVENDTDREARAAEPGAYALTYEEAITVLRANNIITTVMLQNDYITEDAVTRTPVYTFTPESTQKIIDAFEQRGFDPDDLYNLAERVLSSNWYTLMLSQQYSPGKGKGPGFYLLAMINGKLDQGILRIEDYPAVYDGSSRSDQRDALKLPRDAGFLFSLEQSILTTLRRVCNPQTFIEEKIGYLPPYGMMPNAAPFNLVSRFMNDPYVRPKNTTATAETTTIEKGEGQNEYIVTYKTRNTEITLTIADIFSFLETDVYDPTTGERKRRGALSGVKKAYHYSLQKLMQQSAASTVPDEIIIDLQEMVDRGIYSTTDNAYRAISNMTKKMGQLYIGVSQIGSKKKPGGYLFYNCAPNGQFARISVNKNFGFEFFRSQYTYFPMWAYPLDGNSFNLAIYIFQQMRMNADELSQKGKFTLKLSTVQNHLGLYTVDEVREKHNRRYNDFIKKPILQAVEDVNAAAKKDTEIGGRLKITVKANDKTIDTWLAGYIEISASGDYTNYLNGIAATQRLFDATYKEEKVRQAAKRRANPRRKKAES